MAHYDIFRDRLGVKYPAFGHALWEPNPGRLYPPVEVGDVGFIREGKFHRLFNALLPADHPSHQTFGVPEYHEPLRPRLANHIDNGTLSPTDFCSHGVTVASGGLDVFAREPVGSADVSFLCAKTCGAVLSLPLKAQREDTIARGDFGKWITKNIDSLFAFTRHLGLGIEQMEDIVLVTGRHRTRSWTNIAFFENSQVSFGVRVTDEVSASVNWQVSREHIQGAMLSEGPSGRDLPEDQCIFVRGYRVVRAFKLFPRLKGAAGHPQDPGEDDREPELEVVSMSSVTKYKDPLHVLLEYIAERTPDCDLVLVHDDDLHRLYSTGDRTSLETLQPDAVVGCLQRSEPEIAQVACGTLSPENDDPGTNTRGSVVALFSDEFNSWGISQQWKRLPPGATSSVPVPPPVHPAVQTTHPPITVATTLTVTPQLRSRPAPGIPVHSPPLSPMGRTRKSLPSMSNDQPLVPWQIGTRDDVAISAIQTSLAVLKEGALAATLPYIATIAGLLLRALTMRNEVMRCKLECEILVHKTARIAKIIVNIGKVCETHNLNEEDLPASLRAILRSLVRTGELDRIEHVFKECSQRTKKFLLRAHLLTKIKQCDVELSNVLQAFQAELALDTRFALVVQRREATVDPGPDEAISYNSLEGSPLTPAQPRQYLEPSSLYLSIFFVFLCVAFFEPVTAIPLGPKSFVFIVGITLIVVWFVGQSRPLPTPVNNTSPLPRRPPLSLPSSSAKQK